MEDISQGISLYKSTPNAVLIDLRDAQATADLLCAGLGAAALLLFVSFVH